MNDRRRDQTMRPMLKRVALWLRIALWWFFAKVNFGSKLGAALREGVARGTLVYVLQTRSVFDLLYFNYVFLKHRLPLAKWSNGPSTTWFMPMLHLLRRLFRRRSSLSEENALSEVISNGDAALIFLERPAASESESRAYSQRFLERLCELEAHSLESIVVAPLLIVWDRRSEEFRPSLLAGTFGTRQHPGFLRKVLGVIQNLWQPFFLMGAPHVQVCDLVPLSDFRPGTGEKASIRAEALRVQLLAQLEQERSTVIGPRFKKGAVIKREILADESVQSSLARLKETDSRSLEEITRVARENLNEIAADFSMLTVKLMAAALTPVWQNIYDGLEVDEEGLDRVRTAARDSSIVVVPSHKSHIDYLIISYIFFQYGLVPPHIAAGDNLDFPPIGSLFRRAGAFFIRRQIKDDPLYKLCLRLYLAKILSEGHGLEFFIEGGRSRTGKLMAPRFGMLRMIVDAFGEGTVDKVKIVPCAVTYERVIEGRSHQAEVQGAPKKQEHLGALLRSTKVLTSKNGRLYVTFGEILDLGEYMKRYEVEPVSPPEQQHALTQRLGYRLIYEINQAGTATPSALASLALLTLEGRRISRPRLLAAIGFTLDMLLRKGVRLSPSLQTALASKRAQLKAETVDEQEFDSTFLSGSSNASPSGVFAKLGQAVAEYIDEAIKGFSDGNLVEFTTVKGSQSDLNFFYGVPEKGRGELSYYKNTIVHNLVPDALLATALLEPGEPRIEVEPLMERTLLLSRLFKHEFFYEERAEFKNVFWRTFKEFEARGWLQLAEEPDAAVMITPETIDALTYFHRIVLTFLETYTLVAGELDHLQGRWVGEKDFIDHLKVTCQVRYHEGVVRYVETLAMPTFKNALRRFIEWGLVEDRTVQKRRKPSQQLRFVEARWRETLNQLICLLRGRKKARQRVTRVD